MDEPVETNAQLRQHCVHIFPIHGLPHVLHLPTDVGTYLGAGLSGGGYTRRNMENTFSPTHYLYLYFCISSPSEEKLGVDLICKFPLLICLVLNVSSLKRAEDFSLLL